MRNQSNSQIQEILSYKFKDESLLKTALTHRSCLNDPNIKESYERLEFLGDAILEMLISTYLYLKYPDKMEGYLTSARSAIVRTESLSRVSKKYGFNSYILMSKGEEASGGRKNDSILEDTIESLIGALYLDGGLNAAKSFFDTFIIPNADEIILENKLKDSKSLFQEKVQAIGLSSPTYQTINQTGPDHNRIFEVIVCVEGKEIGRGAGKNKQEAEQKAAQEALNSSLFNTQVI